MKILSRKSAIYLLGAITGGITGYCYWYFYGCDGACAITSSPLNSTIYGIVSGTLLFSFFIHPKKQDNTVN